MVSYSFTYLDNLQRKFNTKFPIPNPSKPKPAIRFPDSAPAALVPEPSHTVFSFPDKCPGPEGCCPDGPANVLCPLPPHVFLRPSMPHTTKPGSSGRADPRRPSHRPHVTSKPFSFKQSLFLSSSKPCNDFLNAHIKSSLLCLAFKALHDHPNNLQLCFIPKG